METLSVGRRIEALLDHLGAEQVHVGACMSADWGDLVGPLLRSRVSTLTVVAPHLNKGIPADTVTFDRPTVVVSGDQGTPATKARALAKTFPLAKLIELSDYSSPIWANTVADRLVDVKSAMLSLLSQPSVRPAPIALREAEGSHAGITYRISGSGPPLMLLPLSLSAEQWEPLIEELNDNYCVISLGGAHLGAVALLEDRAASGYGEMVATVLDVAGLHSNEVALEVGCGSGALSRQFLARSDRTSQMIATDMNKYLLAEATALAQASGIADRVRFEEADAGSLPYGDGEFDVAVSCTVLEEGNADQMLAELVRVTKSNGRIAVITRAIDVDWWVGLSLPEELRRKLNANGPKTGAGAGADGCADVSIYRRARKAGIQVIRMGPQFAVYRNGGRLEDVLARLGSTLEGREYERFLQSVEVDQADDTVLVCEPFHCVVGEVL